jgi:PAS domain S-box-containing protein
MEAIDSRVPPSPAKTWSSAPTGVVTYINAALCDYLGIASPPLPKWRAFVHAEDIVAAVAASDAVLCGAADAGALVRLRRHDGQYRWHKIEFALVAGVCLAVAQIVATAADVHELVIASERHRAGEQRLRKSLDNARIGAWEWDMEARVAILSDCAAGIYGLPPGTTEVPLSELWECVAGDGAERFAMALSECLLTRLPFELTFPLIRRDGERRQLRLRADSESDFDRPHVRRVFGVAYDVTEQCNAEEERERSERRYRALAELGIELSWTTDATGTVILAGAAQWERFTGQRVGARIEHGWLDSVHPEERDGFCERWFELVRRGRPATFALRLLRRDGAYRSMTTTVVPIFDARGQLVEWFGVTSDHTEDREAAAATDDRNVRLHVAMRAAGMTTGYLDLADWSVGWDGPGTVAEADNRRTRLSYAAALDHVHGDDREKLDLAVRRVVNGEDMDRPIEFRLTVDGKERWMQGSLLLQHEPHVGPQRLIGSLVDINERKALELTLRDSDRRKDEFLAMLAHELRNPLAPMRTAIALMERNAAARAGPDVIRLLQRQVDHMARLVDDLLEVSRITHGRIKLRRAPLLVGTTIYAAVETIASMTTLRRQKLTVSLPSTPAWVRADSARLSQILVNVLNNASKYTQEGGELRIVVRADGKNVTICCQDNGSGVSPELLPHIFELFSQGERTLDRSQGGLGIGLSLVKRLVDMHDGAISLESPGPGKGTTVTITLAQIHPENVRPPPNAPVGARPAASRQSGTMHILIVDDNRDAADSLGMLCETEGYTVTIAYGSHEAVKAAQEKRPDVALLDIGLPDIDGYELAQRIRMKGERSPILIAVTGYGQADDHLRARAAGFDHHLVKPVDIERLFSLLASAQPEGGTA